MIVCVSVYVDRCVGGCVCVCVWGGARVQGCKELRIGPTDNPRRRRVYTQCKKKTAISVIRSVYI